MRKPIMTASPHKLESPETFDPAQEERLYQLVLQSATDALWDGRIPEDKLNEPPSLRGL
jgi:hypothetical protein